MHLLMILSSCLLVFATGFLHGVVHRLIEKVKIKTKIHPALCKYNYNSSIPNLDAAAMAVIVVALKLYYGIDDKTEK